MKTDILDREDIQKLINEFYKLVEKDDLIGQYFTEVAKVDWSHHLPQMYDFWESILFAKSVFKGNPMRVHMELNQKQALTFKHFDHWLKLFTNTIDSMYAGINATKLKEYAGIIKENLSQRVVGK